MEQPMQAAMRQYRPEKLTQRPQWATQQQLPPALKSSLSMNDGAADAYSIALGQYWGSASGIDPSGAWNNAQFMIPELNSQLRQNSNFIYNHDAAQHVAAQRHSSYGGQLSWTPSALRGAIASTSTSVSDFESNHSLSPQSYLSDGMGASFSPGSVPDQASPRGDWNVSGSSGPMKESAPQFPSTFSPTSLGSAFNNNFRRRPGVAGLADDESGIAASSLSIEAGRPARAPVATFKDCDHTSPDGSLTSANSSNSSWYTPGYSPSSSGARLAQQNTGAFNASCESDLGASPTGCGSSSFYAPASGRGSHVLSRPQDNLQARFQAPRTSDVEAQRQHNDDILVQGKQDGMTYREIRKKMLGEKPAESTLRGRYRSLTKARKDRVRKPQWHRCDIELLSSYVNRELERIEKTLSNPRATSIDQKLIKVRWKEVADFIKGNGGSYHFGNSTCKRKWKELNPQAK
ncbi:hypothetical protein T440DRAFT_512976 [Plenodomus tracheiphilus IPT5]|uniref:Myb-like domain-containing protein n=1 Tax=Plenodomus tracheiphilus IPT5 TaxID=1408161 RepID=A0A6A7BPZ5_9PLEO|nr:hypothetical protein T440DRAFT_512976 [Plenodomus tracheiphilus IPT5]